MKFLSQESGSGTGAISGPNAYGVFGEYRPGAVRMGDSRAIPGKASVGATLLGSYPFSTGYTSSIAAFETWLGRTNNFVLAYSNGPDWPTILTNTDSQITSIAATGRTINWVLGLPTSGATLAGVVAGTYDASLTSLANKYLAARPGDARIIVSIFKEFQNQANAWTSVGVESTYIAAFQHVVTLFRGISSKFKFEWCPNYTTTVASVQYNPMQAYPGDTFVDFMAQDVYKIHAFDGDGAAAWNIRLTETYGLNFMVAQAAAHSKPLALGEVGIDNDVDGPFFDALKAWLATNKISYWAYFNANSTFNNRLDQNQYPTAGTKFITDFGVAATSAPLFANNGSMYPFASAIRPVVYDAGTNLTWAAWQSSDGVNLVIHCAVYNHAGTTYTNGSFSVPTNSWSDPFEVGVCIATTFQQTDHGFPSIVIAPNGKAIVFFGTWFQSALQYATVNTAGDPTTWTQGTSIGNTTTDCPNYPQAVTVGTTIYLFSQNSITSSNNSVLQVRTSADSGATWSAFTSVADVGSGNEWFPGNMIVVGTDIWIMATRGPTAGVQPRDNIYLLRYDTTNGGVKNVDASVTTAVGSLPILAAALISSYAVVIPTGGNAGIVGTLAFDGSNVPYVIYASGTNTVQYFNDYDVRVAKFSGGVWSTDVTGLGTMGCGFSSACIVTETDGSLTAYWPQKNTTLYAAGTKNGGDVAMSHRSLGGVWSAKTIVQVAGQTSGAFSNPDGLFPLDGMVPVAGGQSGLQLLWTEVAPTAAAFGQAFLPRHWIYAYGSGTYRSASRTRYNATGTAGLMAKFFPKPTSIISNIDTLVGALQSANLLAANQGFYVFAMPYAQNALISWAPPTINSLTFIRYNKLTVNGSPTFTANQGYQGNGTSDYLDSGGTIVNGTQNSLSGWAWALNASSNNQTPMGTGVVGQAQLFVAFTGALTVSGRASNTTAATGSVTTQAGMLTIDRTANNLVTLYQNATSLGTNTTLSTALPAGNVSFLANKNNSQYSNQLVAAGGFGLKLTAPNVTAQYNAVHTFLQAVAGVP